MKLLKVLAVATGLCLSSMVWAGPVNINTADAESIAAELNGVGEKKAQAIIAYREANGAFTSADDLINVKGISVRTVDKNRDSIVLE